MISIRSIKSTDNAPLALIIRQALAEFGADKPGTVYTDPSTDYLSKIFDNKSSIYFVAEENGIILGGGGIYPTQGLPEGTCELVKMYLTPQARGKGIGRKIMDECFAFAKKAGYQQIYLESMPELAHAVAIYERLGFERIGTPLGQSGHFSCNIWMLKSIKS